MQTCPGCHKTMPLNEFHKDCNRVRGVKSRCKACRVFQTYHVNKRLPLKNFKGVLHKSCKRCLMYKPLEKFCKHVRGRGGVAGQCRHCRKRYDVKQDKIFRGIKPPVKLWAVAR